MAPPSRKNPNLYTYHLCFLLLVSTTTLSAALSTSYSSVCQSLTPAQDIHTDRDDALSLTRSFQISTGYFPGGEGSLFSADDDLYSSYRSFSLFPHGAFRTNVPALVHLAATLTITGPRSRRTYRSGGYRQNFTLPGTISFFLDGYYSSASLQLCMVGTGTEQAADGSLKYYTDVALHLRVPSPPSLTDPFVTGTLEGSDDFGTIHLLAYAEGDKYKYGSERADCGPPRQQARGSFEALGGISSALCAHLKEQLMTSYKLEHGGATGPLLPLHESRTMDVNQMQCTEKGDVRAYVVFSNDTGSERRGFYYSPRSFLVGEEAVVAEGRWDEVQGVLCLRACRVVRSVSVPSALAVREHECGIGMSFWFPAVWTIQDRSLVAGMLRNSTRETTGNNKDDAALITASSIDGSNHNHMIIFEGDHRSSNLSDVKYSYNDTILEEAKKHYDLKFNKEKIKGSQSHSFPGNYTYRDFEFQFYGQGGMGNGKAVPITIGSVMVYGERLAAEDSFSKYAVVVDKKHLLRVSYDIQYSAPRERHRITNGSVFMLTPDEQQRISAEGVYDPERGILCMLGCRDHNGSTDCQILVTVKFSSLDARGQGHGRGVISSLRDNRTDGLFFEKIDIHLYGMFSNQVSEAISRVDLESIMLVASATLSCVFTVLQILHTKKNPEAAPATSITMLAILTLGYLTPLVLNFEAMFMSRRSRYFEYPMGGSIEMHEMMMRAPILIAFVLQLRLLQLAWSGRRKSADQATSSPVVSERIVLQICLPLYMLGAVLAAIVHVFNVRAAREDPLVVRIGGEPATIWEDLVSYAGLILDGFLLPQVILNASLAGSGVRAISPWFYIGCTMNRAVPHVYDVVRGQIYEQSINPSDIYASPRGDLFGVAWDIVIPCGAALLAALVFLQQRLRGASSLPSHKRTSGGYELVSNL